MTTVREALVAEYGEDWAKHLSHVIDVGERREQSYVTVPGSRYPDYSVDYIPAIAISATKANDCWGYDNPVDTSNYRVLADQWSEYEGLSDGWYQNCNVIALDLDSEAPEDLIEVLDGLADYPVIDEQEWSNVEQEFIQEHWESYGKSDVLDAVAKAIGADSGMDLTEYAEEMVTALVWDGILDYGPGGGYPTMIDDSACDFGDDAVAQWVKAHLGLVVSVKPHNGYGDYRNLAVLMNNLVSKQGRNNVNL